MKSLGNINLGQNQIRNAAFGEVSDYPSSPRVGQIIFKDRRLLICVSLSPITWTAVSQEMNTHIHRENEASVTWTINHKLNISEVILTVVGTDGKHVIPENVTYNFNQTIVTFDSAQAGAAILMAGSEIGLQL